MHQSADKYGRKGYDTTGGRRLLKLADGLRLPWWHIHEAEPPKWSVRVAKSRAAFWVANGHDDVVLLLLGRRVCEAFELPTDSEWLEWYRSPKHRHPMIAFPHPSPLNRWWNEPENEQAAKELLIAVAKHELPYVERGAGGQKK